MPELEDRTLADDWSTPVVIEPGHDVSQPEDRQWKHITNSQPNAATFHLTHSDVTPVTMDVLRPSDSEADALFVITRNIPLVIVDSGDQYWVGESKVSLPLQGLRVPIEGDTIEEGKKKLAADLAAQFRLLLVLSTTHNDQLAPQLKFNLALLSQFMAPNPALEKK